MRRRMSWIGGIGTLAAITFLLPTLGAQTSTKADAAYLLKAYDTYRSMLQSSPYRTVPWQYLGPTNVSCRATDVAVADRGTTRRIYSAYATGGVWKTDDNGASWQPVFENHASTSIGDIAVAPSNPDIVWVGTGEANLFRASMAGVGIYKSTDAGRTFTHSGLTDTQTIARIIVHPTNPEIVYVASTGHAWTDNEMRGVFKTTDGGRTWNKIFYRSARTGAADLVMDPSDPNTLYASMWQRLRRKWSDPRVESGYTEGGIWKTTDGGATWAEANDGLPAARFRGRIGIDISAVESGHAVRVRRQLRRGAAAARRTSATPTSGRSSRAASRRRRSTARTTRARRGARSRTAMNSCPRTPAPTAGCSVRFASIRRTPTPSTAWDLDFTSLATPARRSPRCAECTATIMGSGSIRRRPRLSTTRTMAASTRQRTPGRRGRSRTRRPARSSTTCRSIHARRSAPTDRSRITTAIEVTSICRPAVTGFRRPSGSDRLAARDPITRSIRRTRTSSIPTASTGTSRARIWRSRRREGARVAERLPAEGRVQVEAAAGLA